MIVSRPAGDSDDSDDEFDNFSFGGDTKTFKERMAESRRDNYKRYQELNSTPENRLYNAIVSNNLVSVQNELNGGTSVNIKLAQEYTSLLLAASHANGPIVQELLTRNVDLTTNKDGLNALMAVCNCNPYTTTSDNVVFVVKLLLEHKIDAKLIDRKRRTALMLASAQGFPDVVKLLLPYSRLDSQDNQGWTALFHAVNHNHIEVAKVLIEAGSNLDHVDVRMNNLQYYASINDLKEILDLFPEKEEPLPSLEDLIDKDTPLETLLSQWEPSRNGIYDYDVNVMLYGANCEGLIPLFRENQVGLYQFLAMNDQDLNKLGVKLSFQRERIKSALYKFHKYVFKNKSMPSVCTDSDYSTYDILVTIANSIKHLTIMEASLNYLKKNVKSEELDKEKLNEMSEYTKPISKRLQSLYCMSEMLRKTAIQLDAVVPYQPDLITKDSRFHKYSLKFTALKYLTVFSLGSLSLILILKLK